ncbi:MAG: YidC/Oxa1 family insertase periplasmic-domain containing protein, partial [Myxococcota bacterium]
DQQKRLLLAMALMFGIMVAWDKLVREPQAEAEAAAWAAAHPDAGTLDAGTAPVAVAPTAVAAPELVDGGLLEDGGVLLVPAPVPVELPVKELALERPTTRLVFSTEGAGLVSAELTGKREREEKKLSIPEGYKKLFGAKFEPAPQMNLARPVPGLGPNLAVSILGAAPVPATQRAAVTEEGPGKVVFTTRSGPWEIVKTFTWSQTAAQSESDPTGYLTDLAVTVKNVGPTAQVGELAVHAIRAIDPSKEEAPSMFGGIGNQASVLCRVGDDVTRKTPPAEGGGGLFSCGSMPKYTEEKSGPLHFVAIDQQYFLTALWPKDGALDGRCLVTAKQPSREATLVVPLSLQAGEAVTKRFGAFLGPKDLPLLLSIGKTTGGGAEAAAVFDPGLDKTVDFGIWAFICKVLIVFLRLFQGWAGNWGLAIILLTVMVKLLLLPLTHKAMVSAESMKKLQPKMEEIRKKYPDDREKQNMEMMKLYQEGKVNPLGGCLPLLLQLPIWAALFTTLRTSYELYGEPFYGVWSDLTSKDPTYLLPLALGVTMIVTQRLQPQMMDKQQAFLMTWVMPVFFTAIMMNYPAGLALYIFTNNLLSIVQQYALRKYLESKKTEEAKA